VSSAFGVSGQSVSSVSAVSSGGQSVRSIGALSSATQAIQGAVTGRQPVLVWEYLAEARLEIPPVVAQEHVVVAGTDGTFAALGKLDGRLLYKFKAENSLSAPMGQYAELAYVPSEDFSLYSLDTSAGRILWRFLGGGPILRKPSVNDESIFVSPERSGLYRISRETGLTLWRNATAEQFLAANRKFVYATDRSGRLLILDRTRGSQLAVYDGTRDFVVPISNELTDRLYLASNDGLLISLHDRDYPTPLKLKNVPEQTPTAAPPPEGKKAPPADKAPVKKIEPPKGKEPDKMQDKQG
jgi:outer membrane protein assembly factor BamB